MMKRYVAAAGVLAAVALGGTTYAMADTAGPGGSPQPASVDPSKTPVTDPTKVTPDTSAPLDPAAMLAEAKEWVAQDPNGRVLCLTVAGTVAGTLELDRVDPSAAITQAQANSYCQAQLPGSHA